MALFNYFIRSVKSNGFLDTMKVIYYGYFRVNKFIVLYLDLKKQFSCSNVGFDIDMEKISLSDLSLLRNQHEKLPIQFFCDQIHGLQMPYIAKYEGKLAAIHWLVFPGEASRFLTLKQADVELNYITVLPQYRGKKIAEALMSFIIISCKEMEIDRMFSIVDVNNIPSWKSMIRVGFDPIEIVTHFGTHRPKASLKRLEGCEKKFFDPSIES